MKEAELVQQVLAGDTDSFAPLVERHHVGLIIYCEQFTRERSTAEDIAQEAFIKAYQSLGKYKPTKGKFATWLYRIARNICLDYVRARRITVDLDEIPEIASVVDDINDQQKADIRAAVAQLHPPIFQAVIEEYYWQGDDYQTIADRHGIPLNTVRTHLRRAKAQLKGVLS